MKKIGKLLGCILPMLVGFLCQAIIAGVLSAIFTVVAMSNVILKETPESIEDLEGLVTNTITSNVDFLLAITGIAIAISGLFGALWYRKYRTAADGTFKQVVNFKLIVTMLMLGLSLQFLISLCLTAVLSLIPEGMSSQYDALLESLVGGNTWISIVVTVIIAPFAEELLFRGVTLKMGERCVPFFAANIIQAFLFGVYHLNIFQGVYAFVLGLVLGFVVHYFHSIWPAILLHAFTNGAAQLLSLIPEDANAMLVYVAMAVLGVILLFASIKLFPRAKVEFAVPSQATGEQEKYEWYENQEYRKF